MDSSTTSKHLKVVDRVHTFYTLKLPHYMVWATTGITSDSMRATAVMLDTGFGYNTIGSSELPIGWQRHVCPGFRIPLVRDANGTILLILLAVILFIRWKVLSTELSFWLRTISA